MARYISDQNKVVLLHESGTYANTSGNGFWVGEVTDSTIDDSENKLTNFYLGTQSRSYGSIEQGPRDVTGTLTINAQNFRLPFWAIGSVVDASSGTNVLHDASQTNTSSRQSAYTSGPLNPSVSFTMEDSKQAPGTGRNFVRTIVGATPNVTTVTATQGEKVKIEADVVAQTLTYSSGATTSVTADTIKPYLWDSTTLTLGGSSIPTAKEISLEINQNLEAPHYLNGSRDISVPFPQNRDYVLNVTLDLNSNEADFLYNDFYKSNETFNAVLDFNQDNTGSQHTTFTMSGCKIMTFQNPSTSEGLTESTIEIKPKDVTAKEWTSTASTVLFNPW